MPYARPLLLGALLMALLAPGAHAQVNPVFAQPFQYTDPEGQGTMTITPLTSDGTRLTFQPISVVLTQSNRRFTGSGVYHSFSDDQANLPPLTLVSFTLLDTAGQSFFFQASIAAANGFTGQGTYWPVSAPQNTRVWRIASGGGTTPTPILNSTPTLRDVWFRNTFAEAIGGAYHSTYNTQRVESTATWSGNLTQDGTYKVEVFIPRQPSGGSVPRTNQATYAIFEAGVAGQQTRRLNQAVSQSGWVELGTFFFRTEYRIVLGDETGETARTRSVVANAVRLTLVR